MTNHLKSPPEQAGEVHSVGADAALCGELWIDNKGEAHFVCHTKDDDFSATKEAFGKFINLLQRQIADEKECPYFVAASPSDAAEIVAEARGWQPIETAPKDGSPLMLFWQGYTNGVTVGFYLDNSNAPTPWQGWRVFSGQLARYGQPTHWMPLPDPPDALREAERHNPRQIVGRVSFFSFLNLQPWPSMS